MRLSLKVIKRRKNGRFDQRDSYMGQHGTPLSENRYMYVWNNPNKYIDPSGHKLAIEGADPGMEDAINKADRQYDRYLRGEITRQEFIDLVGAVWTQYNLDFPEYAVEVGQTTDSAGKLADSEYAKNRADEARAAREVAQQAVIDDLMNELINQRNINIPDLSGLSREEQIRILREIKKICDEIEGKYGKWDEAARDEAQKKVDEIVVDGNNDDNDKQVIDFTSVWNEIVGIAEKLKPILLFFLDIFLGFVPILGPLFDIISGFAGKNIITGSSFSVFESVASVIMGLVGLVADSFTGGAATLAGEAPKLVAKISKTAAKLVKHSSDTIELLGNFGKVVIKINLVSKFPWWLNMAIEKVGAFVSSKTVMFDEIILWLENNLGVEVN